MEEEEYGDEEMDDREQEVKYEDSSNEEEHNSEEAFDEQLESRASSRELEQALGTETVENCKTDPSPDITENSEGKSNFAPSCRFLTYPRRSRVNSSER